jgi:hypothetical protein
VWGRAPSRRTAVSYLPDEHEVRNVAGTRYYLYANTYYRSVYRGTDQVYQVVRPPA